MDTHEIIHEEEKTQIVEAFKKLQELVSDTMSHDDTRKVKEILEEAVKDGSVVLSTSTPFFSTSKPPSSVPRK